MLRPRAPAAVAEQVFDRVVTRPFKLALGAGADAPQEPQVRKKSSAGVLPVDPAQAKIRRSFDEIALARGVPDGRAPDGVLQAGAVVRF